MTTPDHPHVSAARAVLTALGFTGQQTNESAALTLLALAALTPDKAWSEASAPLIGVTPIMDWIGASYGRHYKPNTRETIRKGVLKHFVERGLALYNPDDPARSVNSPNAAYQLSDHALELLRHHGGEAWGAALDHYLASFMGAAASAAQLRAAHRIPLLTPDGEQITLSPGPHSELIRDIAESFKAHFAADARLIYVGDTGDKWAYSDAASFTALGITLDRHGKMPDVVLWWEARGWLLLVEAVTSHGPVDPLRRAELERLFRNDKAGLVHITALPDRKQLASYIAQLAWETEIWLAAEPDHLIHLNGDRFLGPH